MSVGMTKFYRVACFKEIGGFVREVMWYGIDYPRCRMLGSIAESVDLEPIRFATCARRALAIRASGPSGLGSGSGSTLWAPRPSTTWWWSSTAYRHTQC